MLGINKGYRMETPGYGETKPIADNQNPDGSDNPLRVGKIEG